MFTGDTKKTKEKKRGKPSAQSKDELLAVHRKEREERQKMRVDTEAAVKIQVETNFALFLPFSFF